MLLFQRVDFVVLFVSELRTETFRGDVLNSSILSASHIIALKHKTSRLQVLSLLRENLGIIVTFS